MATAAAGAVDSGTDAGFFGHPRGLSTLFFTEMWERFSYYGMRAFLILYMTASAANGGLGFADTQAASIYGLYTGSVWGGSILGGIIADRFLGQYRSVLLGGAIIAAGHFTLAFHALPFFYSGLALIVIGTGLLKPNVSTMVGSLYPADDSRRDAGFSLFYMGINLGAMLGPIIAGYLAQRVDWHLGFACAGVGMALGLTQYVWGRGRLKAAIERLSLERQSRRAAAASQTAQADARGFTASEWKRIGMILILVAAATLFWAAYEQAGSTLTLFADRYTRLDVFGIPFPSSWFQSVQPIFVILLAPVFAWIWIRLGRREPSIAAKFGLGLLFMGAAFLILIPAGAMAQAGGNVRVSPWWLFWSYAVSELGELCISPVGLSAVTRLAPLRIVGLMMGVWFLGSTFGNLLAGYAAALPTYMSFEGLFVLVTAILAVAALVMFALIKPIQRLMATAD
jgi:POT family proton-dependent oligopeptide transporter